MVMNKFLSQEEEATKPIVRYNVTIKRGEIWLTNFDPGFGTELHKIRPSLVISSNEVNKHHPRVIVIPVSTKNYSGLSVVNIASKESGLTKESVILPAEIRAVDKIRLTKRLGKVSKNKLTQVEEIIKLILGFAQ